jgi:hypothetical protein
MAKKSSKVSKKSGSSNSKLGRKNAIRSLSTKKEVRGSRDPKSKVPGTGVKSKSAPKQPVASTPKAGKQTPAAQSVVPVSTGSGPSVMDIAQAQMARIRAGDLETGGSLYSKSLVSVEGVGVNMAFHGMAAVEKKNEEWMATHKIHGVTAEGPFVGANCFAIKFMMDVEDTAAHQRIAMSEVGVYTVENGKIVREEFMYDCGSVA